MEDSDIPTGKGFLAPRDPNSTLYEPEWNHILLHRNETGATRLPNQTSRLDINPCLTGVLRIPECLLFRALAPCRSSPLQNRHVSMMGFQGHLISLWLSHVLNNQLQRSLQRQDNRVINVLVSGIA